MDLLTVVLTLVVIGVLMALLNKYGPPYIDPWFITAINVIVIIAVVLWLLNVMGFLAYVRGVKVPHV